MRFRSVRWWMRSAVVVAILPLVVGACSSSGSKLIGAPSTSATTSTTTQAELDATIVGQWLLAQQSFTAVKRDPTSQAANLLLSDYVTEPFLSYFRAQFAERAIDGIADIGTITYGQPRVTSISDGQATVVSCINDGLVVIVKATGKVLPGTDPNLEIEGTTSTMLQSPSGVWMLSENVIEVGSCAGV